MMSPNARWGAALVGGASLAGATGGFEVAVGFAVGMVFGYAVAVWEAGRE